MDDKKVIIEIELDQQDVAGALFLAGKKLQDEQWQKLTSATIILDTDGSADAIQIKIAVTLLAITQIFQ